MTISSCRRITLAMMWASALTLTFFRSVASFLPVRRSVTSATFCPNAPLTEETLTYAAQERTIKVQKCLPMRKGAYLRGLPVAHKRIQNPGWGPGEPSPRSFHIISAAC